MADDAPERRREEPRQFESVLTEWAQRLAVLALPMSAALLGLMFFWRRGVYMFDHLIFSMHSLSFQGLLVALAMAGVAAERLVRLAAARRARAPVRAPEGRPTASASSARWRACWCCSSAR